MYSLAKKVKTTAHHLSSNRKNEATNAKSTLAKKRKIELNHKRTTVVITEK
jgi:hypothetical protein